MLNNNSQLNQHIKQTLKSFEVPHNEGQWLEIKSKVEIKPKSSVFKKYAYSLNVIIILTLIGGAFIIAKNTGLTFKKTSPEKDNKTTIVKVSPVKSKAKSASVISASQIVEPAEENTIVKSSDSTVAEPSHVLNLKSDEMVAVPEVKEKKQEIEKPVVSTENKPIIEKSSKRKKRKAAIDSTVDQNEEIVIPDELMLTKDNPLPAVEESNIKFEAPTEPKTDSKLKKIRGLIKGSSKKSD